MKKWLSFAVLSLLGSSFAATYVHPDDNLRGVTLCIDNDSFVAQVGALSSVSQKLAQGLYDHFVEQATTMKVPFKEMGEKGCLDWAVDMSFEATTGTPRAWNAMLWVSDDGAYASLKESDAYNNPVSVWSDGSFGVLVDNDGLTDYLIAEGEALIDGLLTAYNKVN